MMSTQHPSLASVRCQHHSSRSSRSSIRLTSSTHQDLSALNSFWFDIWMNSVLDIILLSWWLMIAIARSTQHCGDVPLLCAWADYSADRSPCFSALSSMSLLCLPSHRICRPWSWLSSHTSFAARQQTMLSAFWYLQTLMAFEPRYFVALGDCFKSAVTRSFCNVIIAALLLFCFTFLSSRETNR